MAKLRKGVSYRKIERPYTRKSKFKKKNYVSATPHNHIVKFDMGNLNKEFDYCFSVCSEEALQVRHNALEAARKSCNRVMEKKTGKVGYRIRLRVYPHHILRENPVATGAGADRMSTGMKKSFGKPIGLAAQVRKGQELFDVYVDKSNLGAAKAGVSRIKAKLPCKCSVVVKSRDEKGSKKKAE